MPQYCKQTFIMLQLPIKKDTFSMERSIKMETRKLYYEDCHLQTFTAVVTACREAENGFLVTLDATAFYPEGGGQPCDLGMIADAQVLDVQEEGDAVVHLCSKALPVGQAVNGTICWERRFDLMQQHTGEHIVSGIAHKLFGCHNVGFHMGSDVITIDFDIVIPQEKLPQIEQLANEAVMKNLPVICSYPEPEALQTIPYRSKKQLPWPVRIVEIPGADICACCGVHTKTTGEIGLIKLLSCVKFHQGVRIEMVCGIRAWAMMAEIYEQNRLVSQAFSAKILETGAAAERMNEALAAEKYRAAGLEKQLFQWIARSYVNHGDVVHFAENLSSSAVRELAEQIACVCSGMAAVFSQNGDGTLFMSLVNKTGSVTEVGKALIEAFGGKGGGKEGFFQGSITAAPDDITAFFAR